MKKIKKEDKKILNERCLKCEHCYYKWSDAYCMKKKFDYLNKRCIRRIFIG